MGGGKATAKVCQWDNRPLSTTCPCANAEKTTPARRVDSGYTTAATAAAQVRSLAPIRLYRAATQQSRELVGRSGGEFYRPDLLAPIVAADCHSSTYSWGSEDN
uniref:Uncharacterized protein n=1 Tax=Plectus sambesii TaxID=2011161 RepID=A0A914V361_9BILA